MKTCATCKTTKPLDAFYKRPDGGAQYQCKECKKAYERRRYAEDPEFRARTLARQTSVSARRRATERLYGMPYGDYQRLYDEQGGVCAICKSHPHSHALPVDHDHRDGGVRGLLCHNCNRGIGLLGDNPNRLRAAVAYLERARPTR